MGCSSSKAKETKPDVKVVNKKQNEEKSINLDELDLEFDSDYEIFDVNEERVPLKVEKIADYGFLRTFMTIDKKTIIEQEVMSKSSRNIQLKCNQILSNQKFESEFDLVSGDDESNPCISLVVKPLQRFIIGRINILDESQPIDYKMTFEQSTFEADKEYIRQLLKDQSEADKLKKIASKEVVYFVDEEFKPGLQLLYGNKQDGNAKPDVNVKDPIAFKLPMEIYVDDEEENIDNSDEIENMALKIKSENEKEPNQDLKLESSDLNTLKPKQENIPISLFYQNLGPNPMDVVLEQFDHSWLISAFAILAEKSALVNRIFMTQNLNKQFKFLFRFCKNGNQFAFAVDGFLPIRIGATAPAFGYAKNRQLQVSLLEKAYAKMCGGYYLLKNENNRTHNVLQDLTGFPTFNCKLPPSNADILQENMNRQIKYERTLMFATFYHKLMSTLKVGLVTNHSYAIVDLREYQDHRFIILRNPQTKYPWKGDQSFNSSLQTKELLEELKPSFQQEKLQSLNNLDAQETKQVNLEIFGNDLTSTNTYQSEDGTFQMSLNDFFKVFNTFGACIGRSNYQYIRHSLKFVNVIDSSGKTSIQSSILRIVVPENAVLEQITLIQEDEIFFGSESFIDIGALVVDESTQKVINQLDSLYSRSTQKEVNLGPGTYLIMPYSSGIVNNTVSANIPINCNVNEEGEEQNQIWNFIQTDRNFTLVANIYYTTQNNDQLPVEESLLNYDSVLYQTLCRQLFAEVFDHKNLNIKSMSIDHHSQLYRIHILSLGELELLGLETTQKMADANQNIIFSIDVRSSVSMIPTFDSYQKLEEKNFELEPKRDFNVIGKFLRCRNSNGLLNCSVVFDTTN